jgi:hypothetical protein
MAIWYIMWSFGIFSSFWYVLPRINLATLLSKQTPLPVHHAFVAFHDDDHGRIPESHRVDNRQNDA